MFLIRTLNLKLTELLQYLVQNILTPGKILFFKSSEIRLLTKNEF